MLKLITAYILLNTAYHCTQAVMMGPWTLSSYYWGSSVRTIGWQNKFLCSEDLRIWTLMFIFTEGSTLRWDIPALCQPSGFIQLINALRPRQNGRHFADDILKCIFLIENIWNSINISLKFVRKGRINNISALVQIMAWRRPGDKPLSEPMMVSLPTHICVTRPQWVKDVRVTNRCGCQWTICCFATGEFGVSER